jgi:hypothetical protein
MKKEKQRFKIEYNHDSKYFIKLIYPLTEITGKGGVKENESLNFGRGQRNAPQAAH